LLQSAKLKLPRSFRGIALRNGTDNIGAIGLHGLHRRNGDNNLGTRIQKLDRVVNNRPSKEARALSCWLLTKRLKISATSADAHAVPWELFSWNYEILSIAYEFSTEALWIISDESSFVYCNIFLKYLLSPAPLHKITFLEILI